MKLPLHVKRPSLQRDLVDPHFPSKSHAVFQRQSRTFKRSEYKMMRVGGRTVGYLRNPSMILPHISESRILTYTPDIRSAEFIISYTCNYTTTFSLVSFPSYPSLSLHENFPPCCLLSHQYIHCSSDKVDVCYLTNHVHFSVGKFGVCLRSICVTSLCLPYSCYNPTGTTGMCVFSVLAVF